MREQLEHVELWLRLDNEPSETLWVRRKEKTGKGDIVVGICYRSLDQEGQADEALHRQSEVASGSQALYFMAFIQPPWYFREE